MAEVYYCGCCTSRSATFMVGIISFIVSTSLLIVALDSIIFDNVNIPEGFKYESVFVTAISLINSSCCIAGACRESRRLLLPWLFFTSVVILGLFLTSLYYIFFEFVNFILLGLLFFFAAGVGFYVWTIVATYYTKLRDAEMSGLDSVREYMSPEDVVRPQAFVISPPPPYDLVYENPVELEKPPSYEEARVIDERSRVGRV